MKLSVYLNYPGCCEEAFLFYQQHLGGKLSPVQRHGPGGDAPNFPPGWETKVLHARLEIAGVEVMGADIPGAEPMRSAYLALTSSTPEEAERLYALLSNEGQIFMKMEETFFAKRFAMLRDKFGTSWMLLCEP
jgi:PhnB protein